MTDIACDCKGPCNHGLDSEEYDTSVLVPNPLLTDRSGVRERAQSPLIIGETTEAEEFPEEMLDYLITACGEILGDGVDSPMLREALHTEYRLALALRTTRAALAQADREATRYRALRPMLFLDGTRRLDTGDLTEQWLALRYSALPSSVPDDVDAAVDAIQGRVSRGPWRSLYERIETYVWIRYRINVRFAEIPKPYTADLNGKEILIGKDVTPEEAVFLLLHLFGHTVQWNTSPDDLALGRLDVPSNPSAELVAALVGYEQRAAQYGQQLLRDLQVTHLDQWFADMAACDLAYLTHFYTTGEKREFFSFWRDGTPIVEPVPIPSFTPHRVLSRAGTVI